jgi:hypothetical protein
MSQSDRSDHLHVFTRTGALPALMPNAALRRVTDQRRATPDPLSEIAVSGGKRARQLATSRLCQTQRSCHGTGRDAARSRGLRAPSRCTTEPTKLKCRKDSPHRWMTQGAQLTTSQPARSATARNSRSWLAEEQLGEVKIYTGF